MGIPVDPHHRQCDAWYENKCLYQNKNISSGCNGDNDKCIYLSKCIDLNSGDGLRLRKYPFDDNNGWIRVNDHLPRPNQRVLVLVINMRDGSIFTLFGCYYGGHPMQNWDIWCGVLQDLWEACTDDMRLRVVAWMPYPDYINDDALSKELLEDVDCGLWYTTAKVYGKTDICEHQV